MLPRRPFPTRVRSWSAGAAFRSEGQGRCRTSTPSWYRAWIRALSCGLNLRFDEIPQACGDDVQAPPEMLDRKLSRVRVPVGGGAADAEQLGRYWHGDQQRQAVQSVGAVGGQGD